MTAQDGQHPCGDYCQLWVARRTFAQAQELLDQARRLGGRAGEGSKMSLAKWCDQGNHPFSARDIKAEHWTRNMAGPDGARVDVDWDVCGPCLENISAAAAPPQAQPQPQAALAGPHDG